jgi:hypothetical protein
MPLGWALALGSCDGLRVAGDLDGLTFLFGTGKRRVRRTVNRLGTLSSVDLEHDGLTIGWAAHGETLVEGELELEGMPLTGFIRLTTSGRRA